VLACVSVFEVRIVEGDEASTIVEPLRGLGTPYQKATAISTAPIAIHGRSPNAYIYYATAGAYHLSCLSIDLTPL